MLNGYEERAMPAQKETTYNISTLATERAAIFGQAINQSPNVASRKFRSFTKAYLSRMRVGEEQKFPIPSISGKRRSLVLKKLGDEDFSVRVI